MTHPLKAAIIGAGFIADFHARGYARAQDVSLCAVADVDEARAKALADQYGARAYGGAGEMLRRETPDLVSVCVPTFLHEESVCQALAAGANVLCEKPFALTLAACARMRRAAREANRMLMVGQVLRWWPEYSVIAQRVRAMAGVRFLRAGRVLHGRPGGWTGDPGKGGGALFDLHVHDVDFAVSLLGTGVAEVSAIGVREENGAWSRMETALTFENGVRAQIEAGNRMPEGFPFTAHFRAEAADACLQYEFQAPVNIQAGAPVRTVFRLFEKGGATPLSAGIPPEEDAQRLAFSREIAAFVRGVRAGESPLPVSESMAVMRLIHLVSRSLETGERITGAARLVREPWPEEGL